MRIIVDHEKCTLCQLCVLACSFHHAKLFNMNRASIEVNAYGKERKIKIIINEQTEEEKLACDYCEGEREPLCIKYCIPKALNIKGS